MRGETAADPLIGPDAFRCALTLLVPSRVSRPLKYTSASSLVCLSHVLLISLYVHLHVDRITSRKRWQSTRYLTSDLGHRSYINTHTSADGLSLTITIKARIPSYLQPLRIQHWRPASVRWSRPLLHTKLLWPKSSYT